jgi:hypothetical protein
MVIMLPFERKMEITRVKKLLLESDACIIRVVEDLITELLKQNIIDKSIFPYIVYEKIKQRKDLRNRLQKLIREEEEETKKNYK